MSFETDLTLTDTQARLSFLADILAERGAGAAVSGYNRCRRHDPTPLGVVLDLRGQNSGQNTRISSGTGANYRERPKKV